MSASDHSPAGLSPTVETLDEPHAVENPSLSAITDRDSQLCTLSHTTVAASSLLDDHQQDSSVTVGDAHHDLAPVHHILVQLAVSLQVKVDQAARNLAAIRIKLAKEIERTAEVLTILGEVKLPSGFPASVTLFSLSSPQSPQAATIAAIHQYRDQAVSTLTAQAVVLKDNSVPRHDEHAEPTDFNTASDRLDSSFQQLRRWLDQLGGAARSLQNCDGENNTLKKFSSEQCRDIDSLEREAVMEKMRELSERNCSIQRRKPVRSLGHTLDLQEIMLLAENAKSLVYEVSLQMLKIVNLLVGEESSAQTCYLELAKENNELLSRYCFYWKLKTHQKSSYVV